jgi:RHS repeat-associated protein
MPGTGEIFTRTDSSGTMVPLHDKLGSTIGLVNGAGAITTQYIYGPFGTRSVTGAANANPFQFAGMEYDSTVLYHTWARYYSPGLQRFLSEDPLGIGGGDTNIFAYVHNDSVNMTDRLGLISGGAGCEGGECGTGEPPPGPPPIYPGNQVNPGITPNSLLEIRQQATGPKPGQITLEQFDASFEALSVSSAFGLLAGGYVAIYVFAASPAGIAVGAFVGVIAVGSFGYRLFIESGQSSADSNLNEHGDWARKDTDAAAQFNFENNLEAFGYIP